VTALGGFLSPHDILASARLLLSLRVNSSTFEHPPPFLSLEIIGLKISFAPGSPSFLLPLSFYSLLFSHEIISDKYRPFCSPYKLRFFQCFRPGCPRGFLAAVLAVCADDILHGLLVLPAQPAVSFSQSPHHFLSLLEKGQNFLLQQPLTPFYSFRGLFVQLHP